MVRLSRLAVFFLVVAAAQAAFSTTYYIAANGSDSNNGTSKSTPWLHAPGMPSCSSICASTTPKPGDNLILRGGDVWHIGNSSASPYVGKTWTWKWSGTASSYIYIGVDPSWFSGNSWGRPVLDGDNPPSTTGVSSCPFDESTSVFFSVNGNNHIQLDNVEFRGLCWHGNQSNGNEAICCAGFIDYGQGLAGTSANKLTNLYVHGWSHVTFNCRVSNGIPTGNCDGAYGISGDTHPTNGLGDVISQYVCDGSDTDQVSLGCILWAAYDLDSSILRYASQGFVGSNVHVWHDNIIEFINESGDGVTHSNGFEFNSEDQGVNYVYNMVMRDNSAAVVGWVCPNSADVYWNIVSYRNASQPWDFDSTCGGSASFFNSTFADDGAIGKPGSWPGTFKNVLLVNSSFNGTPASQTGVISMTDAQATAAGFTSGGPYSYQPQSGTCNAKTSPQCPIGAGANLTSVWPSGFQTNDTTFACTYNVSSHSMSCPARTSLARPTSGAWDVGAFQFSASSSQGPAPPTGLAATVQ